MFTYSFLVVFKVPSLMATGNLMMGFSTDLPDNKIPTIETVRNWEKVIREEHGYTDVVISNFIPLSN